MSHMQDDKLEAMLKARHIQPASADLSQRIILKSQATPQKTLSLWQWLRQLFAEFHLAKPAYVLAGTLILGLVIGFSEPLTTANDTDSSQVQSFLYADEGML